MPFGEDIYVGVGGRTGDTGQKYASTQDDVRQKFTGYQKDSETSLDFAEARMYENRHGRFTAVDPLLASGKSANPQTFNRYVYVGNSPLVITDPSGMIGDYYDRNGKYLGHDENINDGKVYFAALIERRGKEVDLDKRTIVPTTLLEVRQARIRAVPSVPGTETGALNDFGAGGVQGTSDVTNGVPKGIGNLFIDSINGITGTLIRNNGVAPLPDYVPNPFEIKRYTFGTWKEAMYGNAGYTATMLMPMAAGAPFAAARAPSVVPSEFVTNVESLTSVSTLEPGPFATRSVPSRGSGPLNAAEQAEINSIGRSSGCHTCGATNPGTKSGNHIGDHMPPSKLATPTEIYPQCIRCMYSQGGTVKGVLDGRIPNPYE